MRQWFRRPAGGIALRLCVALSVLAAGGGTFGLAQRATAVEDVRRALDTGAYEEAERAATDVCARLQAQYGEESLELAHARDLLVEALLKNGHAGADSTLELANRVVELKEQLRGPDHLDTALSLHNLGDIRLERGELATAASLHERGLSIRLKQLPASDAAVADSLDRVALVQIQRERWEDARQTLAKAQAIREVRSEQSPLPLAHTLELVGWLNRYSLNYAAASPPVERALAIRRARAPQHPDLVPLLELRGDLLYLRGDVTGAGVQWTEALSFGVRTLGAEHQMMSALQRRLALSARAFGNLSESRQLLERSLEIADRSLAACNPELPAVLNDLASAVIYDGEYSEARKIFQRALAIRERCLGPAHSLTAGVIFNEAMLAVTMGDFAEAERLHTRAVRIWSRALGPDSDYVARGLDALAVVASARKQNGRARAYSERALAIRRRALGNDHPLIARTLVSLASRNVEQGRLDVALRQLDEAIVMYRRAGVVEEPADLAFALRLRAGIEMRRGGFTAARDTLADALTARERVYGKTHTKAAEVRADLAAADFALGRHDAALAAALEAEQTGRDALRFTVRYLPERQALAYADARPKGLDVALSILAAGNVEQVSHVFDGVLQSRSLILDEIASRARSAAGSDPEIAALNTAFVAARQRFANLMLRSLSDADSVKRALLDEARQQKEDAERALADRSAVVRRELERARIGIDEVGRAMPADSALVSVVRYGRTSFAENPVHVRLARTAPAYIAFIMRAGGSAVAVVPLGSAASIDTLVSRWRGETMGVLRAGSTGEAEKSYRAAGTALRRKVWDPIRDHLKDATMVFVVPDGTLNLVSLAALPVGSAQYLIDQGPVIHYLSAERDLVTNASPAPATRGLLAVGGAAFDDPSSFTKGAKRPAAAARVASSGSAAAPSLRAVCGSLQSMQFAPLAGTGREVHEVARLWTGSPSQILENREATERAFKREAPGRRVLHLATHGFFLDGLCPPAAAGTRSVGGLSIGPKREAKLGLGESPLLLAGLALAGANRRAIAGPADEDGILTAEEVTALNLEGVEWAVLSACDTGLGEIKAGEGVLGLRRAFQIAGVRTVIMSLWSVDDQAARLWMRTLYERKLQRNLNTAQAMHEASLSVLRDRRARGQSTHPFYWAGFVATGDWR
jgi:CHAT domain-containing protein/tetratricopeptide (TPR) repeat protein